MSNDDTTPAEVEYRTPGPHDRHILAVKADGFAKIVGHETRSGSEAEACRRLQEAWEIFEDSPAELPRGRFYCELGEDGNFEIGARVR